MLVTAGVVSRSTCRGIYETLILFAIVAWPLPQRPSLSLTFFDSPTKHFVFFVSSPAIHCSPSLCANLFLGHSSSIFPPRHLLGGQRRGSRGRSFEDREITSGLGPADDLILAPFLLKSTIG